MEIQNFPNYLIYDDGRVFSKNYNNSGKGQFRIFKSRPDGYCQITLSNNGKIKVKSIHRLVAEHYIPNPDNKPEVDHINRIRNDNRVENLRWATTSENTCNKGIPTLNKSGYKWICDRNKNNLYRFQRTINGKMISRKHSKSLPKLLCYSFFYLIKHPSN